MSAHMIWVAPILPGREEAWRRFCQALMASRHTQYVASRRRLEISWEEVWLVPSAQGPLAVVAWRTAAPAEIWRNLQVSERPFDRWYRGKLRQICGPAAFRSPAGRGSERLYRWQESEFAKGSTGANSARALGSSLNDRD